MIVNGFSKKISCIEKITCDHEPLFKNLNGKFECCVGKFVGFSLPIIGNDLDSPTPKNCDCEDCNPWTKDFCVSVFNASIEESHCRCIHLSLETYNFNTGYFGDTNETMAQRVNSYVHNIEVLEILKLGNDLEYFRELLWTLNNKKNN